MSITFKQALEKEKLLHPEYNSYIHICRVLQESGASRTEITKLFNKYMPEDEYDKPEKGELIDYLVLIAKPGI
jgi:hypothetical protein